MKLIKYTVYLSLPILLLSSCSQDQEEDVASRLLKADSDEVAFLASLPGVETRSTYVVKDGIDKDGITVATFCTENDPGADGILPTFTQNKDIDDKDDVIVMKDVDGAFRSTGCRWPGNRDKWDNDKWDKKDGQLKFFAFHPSRKEMRARAKVGNECFIYANQTKKDASGVTYDYRLTKFHVAPDISKQVDFVTAITEGNKTENLYSGVKLDFEHQLSGVDISVWGAANLYDIEVAGVRIGGIVTEADFNLSTKIQNAPDNENSIGSWIITDNAAKIGYVDYVYDAGDKVVTINATTTNTKDKAVSIMGNGGKAMVIPYHYNAWDYKNDRKNEGTGKGAYISVLLRMTQHDGDQHRIFPSADPESADYIVYLSVRKSDGVVMKRLDKNGNIFDTSTKYDIPDTEELRHYGWAAAPAKFEWKAGYTYSYVLDYTKGVGVHDPADPNPAIAIIDWIEGIEVITPGTESKWDTGGTIEEGGWGANTNNTAPDGTVWWK